MKKTFAIGAASIAIMASLSTAAHAQQAANDHDVLITGHDTLASTSGDGDGTVTAYGVVDPFYGNIDPFYGNIDPFYGDISPFYGDIGAFWGHINPFYGHINPFYGDISPFYGDINPFYGNISPFYGDIAPFWGDITAFYGDIAPFDSAYLESLGNFWVKAGQMMDSMNSQWAALQAVNALDAQYATVQAQLKELVAHSEAQWGEKVAEKTDKGFIEGFAQEVFARHGLDMNDLSSFAGMTDLERSAFFLDWHDSLMQYSGLDQVDHWMAAVNWTPAVTQVQNQGRQAVIGIIDSSLVTDPDLLNNVVWSGGTKFDLGGHGAGVASLIYAAHDQKGVMGIAPNANVSLYNPFGEDGTAAWSDIADAIVALKTNQRDDGIDTRASIINLSLGEAGWTLAPGIADVFSDPRVKAQSNSTVYVIAAGNDGVAQTTDIEWDFSADPNLILVGSVNPLGEISSFSNTAGSACLLDKGVCHEENRLMNRFIVAPGELLLVSDGKGGVVRRSGTSFAAPLVSGAVALLHDRWQWLAAHPDATTEIIFRSARDLGEPGVDPVYGWGMLDVTASQSPLDFNNMNFTLYQKKGRNYRSSTMTGAELIRDGASGLPSWWEDNEVFFSMIEYVGGTHRDFVVPMSSATYGKRTNVLGGWQYLQNYISGRFSQWILSGGNDSDGDGTAGFSDIRSANAAVPGGWTLRYDSALPRYNDNGELAPRHMAATLADPMGKLSFTLGYGQGAQALAGHGQGMYVDHDRYQGGVNPILGFASGESFGSIGYQLDGKTRVTVGYSENTLDADEIAGLTRAEEFALDRLQSHQAHALTVEVEHQFAPSVTGNLQFTRLREDEALLGVQSTLDGFLNDGASTNAITASLAVQAGHGIRLDLSATGSRSDIADGQGFRTPNGAWGTAGQVALTKQGIVSKNDRLRLAVSQPLTVENGDIEFTQLGVVDRETGELGPVTQSFSIETKRRLVGEAVYAAPLGKTGALSLFGRYESEGNPGETENYVIGGSLNLRF